MNIISKKKLSQCLEVLKKDYDQGVISNGPICAFVDEHTISRHELKNLILNYRVGLMFTFDQLSEIENNEINPLFCTQCTIAKPNSQTHKQSEVSSKLINRAYEYLSFISNNPCFAVLQIYRITQTSNRESFTVYSEPFIYTLKEFINFVAIVKKKKIPEPLYFYILDTIFTSLTYFAENCDIIDFQFHRSGFGFNQNYELKLIPVPLNHRVFNDQIPHRYQWKLFCADVLEFAKDLQRVSEKIKRPKQLDDLLTIIKLHSINQSNLIETFKNYTETRKACRKCENYPKVFAQECTKFIRDTEIAMFRQKFKQTDPQFIVKAQSHEYKKQLIKNIEAHLEQR